MGDFKIEINAVGGHGQDRGKKEGQIVNFFDGGNTTPDAFAKMLVENMRAYGCSIQSATITDWPKGENREESGPVDDLVTGIRKGHF